MPGGIILFRPAYLQLLDNLLPADATNVPVHQLPLIPSAYHEDVVLLATPDDFAAQNVALPRAFARNPAKLLQVVQFQSGIMLAKMNMTLQNGPQNAAGIASWQKSWEERLELGISLATVRQIFPGMPYQVDDATKSVQARMAIAINWLLNRAISHMDEVQAGLDAAMNVSNGSY